MHAIDYDQPERQEANALLTELAADVQGTEGLACHAKVIIGEPFEAIADTAEQVDADLTSWELIDGSC